MITVRRFDVDPEDHIAFLISAWHQTNDDQCRVIEYLASVGISDERFNKISTMYHGSMADCIAATDALVAAQESCPVLVYSSVSDFRNGSHDPFGLYVNQTNKADIQLCVRYINSKIVVLQCVPSYLPFPTAEPQTGELFMNLPDEIEATISSF